MSSETRDNASKKCVKNFHPRRCTFFISLGHENALKVIAEGQKYRTEMIKLDQNADSAVHALRIEKERHFEKQVHDSLFST